MASDNLKESKEPVKSMHVKAVVNPHLPTLERTGPEPGLTKQGVTSHDLQDDQLAITVDW
jgi:hypothetical protein